jgi:5'-nucleotidase / UDP-sugar diphosphatase
MIARRTLLGFLGTLPMVQVARGQVAHRLTIIHLNDFHSRHDPVDAATLGCTTGAACFGGSPQLATAITRQRQAAEADGRAVLLLDGGDQFQGSLFYTALRGDVELAVMHALGTEAMAVGNHEFDNGPANLARFVKAAHFPVLSANIEAGGPLAGLLRPYALFDRGGLRLAVIGLTTEETRTSSSPGPDVRFLPPGPALVAAAKQARTEGATLVVALSHVGLAQDRMLAETAPGIGVIVGGHSHSLLSNVEPAAVGPFPSVTGKTLIVQAGAYGRYLGRLDLDVAADGTVLAWGGEARHVGLDLPPDPAVAAIVAGFAAPLDAVRYKVVGHAGAPTDNTGCRVGECPLGDLVAEALLAADHGAEVAIMNAGGIRTGLPGGDITLGDVIAVLPFGNTLATLKLKGSDLRTALLHGLSLVGRGGFPQVAGMRIGWNPLAPEQSSFTVRQADGRYLPLEPDRVYGVATNNFLRGGGDGYAVLRDAAIDPYDTGPGLEGLVADRIEALSPLRLVADGRLTLP